MIYKVMLKAVPITQVPHSYGLWLLILDGPAAA